MYMYMYMMDTVCYLHLFIRAWFVHIIVAASSLGFAFAALSNSCQNQKGSLFVH